MKSQSDLSPDKAPTPAANCSMDSLVLAIEHIEEQIVITDPEGSIQYCNPAFERVTGYSREEVLGQNSRILKSGKQGPEFYAQLWETIRKGEVWRGHLVNRKKDGTLYEEEATISPICGLAGETIGYAAIKRDVTQRMQLERHLIEAQRMETVGRLAGGVAHDFNNLLTVMNGYADLLLDMTRDPDPLRPYLDEIRSAGERAAKLTKQLLTFSRQQVVQPRELDINALILDFLPFQKKLIDESYTLATDLAPSLGRVFADFDQVSQVLMNLVMNARDSMVGGGTILLQTRNVRVGPEQTGVSPGDYVEISVTDSGRGLSEESRQHIFEPFFRKSEDTTGLEMSMVHGILKQHGGWIDVCSDPLQGTTFRAYLPHVASQAPNADEVQVDTTGIGNIAPPTILLVEDQDSVRAFAKAVLLQQGFWVLEAGDGETAVAQLDGYAGRIDLLVTDVVLPGMNGKLVYERLKSLRPGLKVLFMSGYTADVVIRRGVLDEDVPFLNKPFSPGELVGKVKGLLAL